jgi:hypothetical protein
MRRPRATISNSGLFVPGAGNLTAEEVEEIKSIALRHDTWILIAGSRADGRGVNIESDYSVDGAKGTSDRRSDIDFIVDPDTWITMARELMAVGGGAGRAHPDMAGVWFFGINDGSAHLIVFEPGKDPYLGAT